jgi:two-component system, NtrC family, response regulator HydG
LGKDVIGFEDDVLQTFLQYSWPGNLREFRNVVRRAVLLTPPGEKINASSLPWEINNIEPLHGNGHDVKQAPVVASSAPKKELDLKDAASRAEYETIMAVLQQVNFNKKKAAEVLNIDRKTLYNKIKNFQE